MTITDAAPEPSAPLVLADETALRQELPRAPEHAGEETTERARETAGRLLRQIADDGHVSDELRDTVNLFGADVQVEAAQKSRMLVAPVRELGSRGADEGRVARALTDLRVEVERLDPSRIKFSPGLAGRLMGMMPWVGSPLRRYFARYESAHGTIDAIVQSLQSGRELLHRDNVTLLHDQAALRESVERLRHEVEFARALDEEIDRAAASLPEDAEDRRASIREQVQFPLRQRIVDLQQQLAVSQQGVLATEIIVRNNRELMRGVDRSISVTVTALQTAVAVAFALEHQRIVLHQVAAVNDTTSTLIAGTAERLRAQGSEIQARAADTQLGIEQLRAAFGDIHGALDDLTQFRRNALPQMAQSILDFEQLTTEATVRLGNLRPRVSEIREIQG